jgi:hypothetical protein
MILRKEERYVQGETQRSGVVWGVAANNSSLTPFETNWKKGSGATPLTTQDL